MTRTVLIVDDQPEQREIYAAILLHLGYGVLEAGDAEGALAHARRSKPDAILMDMTLPGGMDGWAATEALRLEPETSGIPIIALTGHAYQSDRERASRLGCASYLAKPVSPRAVADEIGRILGAGA